MINFKGLPWKAKVVFIVATPFAGLWIVARFILTAVEMVAEHWFEGFIGGQDGKD